MLTPFYSCVTPYGAGTKTPEPKLAAAVTPAARAERDAIAAARDAAAAAARDASDALQTARRRVVIVAMAARDKTGALVAADLRIRKGISSVICIVSSAVLSKSVYNYVGI